jgi:hypothetical protein
MRFAKIIIAGLTLLASSCDEGGKPSIHTDLSVVKCPANTCVAPDLEMVEPDDLAMPAQSVFSTGIIDVSGYSFTVSATHSSGYGATASFSTVTYGVGLTCVDSTVANCQLRKCNGDLLAASTTADSVGSFTFTVAGNGPFTFAPDGTNFYTYSPHSPDVSPSPGATVALSLPGLPAVSVVEPDLATLVSPSPGPGDAVQISLQNDYTANLSGGSAGSVVTMKMTGQVSTQSVLITCTGDPTTGKVTAPKAALQIMPPTTNGTLSFTVDNSSAPVQFMGHTTTLKASNVLIDSSGNQTGGFSATFMQ